MDEADYAADANNDIADADDVVDDTDDVVADTDDDEVDAKDVLLMIMDQTTLSQCCPAVQIERGASILRL